MRSRCSSIRWREISGVCQFESKPLGDGDTFSFTFGTTPGICRYICKIHGPMMSGEVSVVAGGPPAANVTINGLACSPANASDGPGGCGTWKNTDNSTGRPIIPML